MIHRMGRMDMRMMQYLYHTPLLTLKGNMGTITDVLGGMRWGGVV